MSNAELKQRLQEYINKGDEKLLKLMYALAREYSGDEKEYGLEDKEIQLLEERWEKYKSGKSKTHEWEEAKDLITNKKRPG